MSNNQDLTINFQPVNPTQITWDEIKTSGQDKIRTGSFEAGGKKYIITVRHSGENTQMDQIADALEKIGNEKLAHLSGHAIKTTPEDLKQKKFVLMEMGLKKETLPEKTSPLYEVASSICNEFLGIYKIETSKEKKWEFEFSGRPDLNFLNRLDQLKENKAINEKQHKEILVELKKLGDLIEKYKEGKEKKDQFYEGLLNCLTQEGKIKGSDGEETTLPIFLTDLVSECLPKIGLIEQRFINGYVNNLTKNNDAFAAFPVTRHIFTRGENNKLAVVEDNTLDWKLEKKEATKILIPVNVEGAHWILYCFDNTDKEKPILYRADSFTYATRSHLIPDQNALETQNLDDDNKPAKFVKNNDLPLLQEMEKQIIKDLKKQLNLQSEIEVKDQEVMQQIHNTCGVHVCKNAEWFLNSKETPPKWNPDSIKTEDVGEFRLDLAIDFLHPKTK